eukprot:Colp12_sorted_trinity150504_noHs@9257
MGLLSVEPQLERGALPTNRHRPASGLPYMNMFDLRMTTPSQRSIRPVNKYIPDPFSLLKKSSNSPHKFLTGPYGKPHSRLATMPSYHGNEAMGSFNVTTSAENRLQATEQVAGLKNALVPADSKARRGQLLPKIDLNPAADVGETAIEELVEGGQSLNGYHWIPPTHTPRKTGSSSEQQTKGEEPRNLSFPYGDPFKTVQALLPCPSSEECEDFLLLEGPAPPTKSSLQKEAERNSRSAHRRRAAGRTVFSPSKMVAYPDYMRRSARTERGEDD